MCFNQNIKPQKLCHDNPVYCLFLFVIQYMDRRDQELCKHSTVIYFAQRNQSKLDNSISEFLLLSNHRSHSINNAMTSVL